jgi:hypothetical protein
MEDYQKSLKAFYNKLESFRKPPPEYPGDRVVHCHIKTSIDGQEHTFEVRGFYKPKDEAMEVSVVNWTLCAGTAWLTLTEDSIINYTIVE